MSVCWDAEAIGRSPCGALSTQDSSFLLIPRIIMRVPDIAREARYDSIRPFVSCGAVNWSRRLNFNETGAELTRRASQLPGPMFGRSSVRAFWPLASVRGPATVPLQTTWIRARTPLRADRATLAVNVTRRPGPSSPKGTDLVA